MDLIHSSPLVLGIEILEIVVSIQFKILPLKLISKSRIYGRSFLSVGLYLVALMGLSCT